MSNVLPQGWEEKELDLLAFFNKETLKNNSQLNLIEYLDTSSVTNNIFEEPVLYKISEAPSRAKRIVEEDDIVISTVRPNLEHFGYLKNVKKNLIVSTGFVTITTIKNLLNSKFCYYFLSQNKITNYLMAVAQTSTSTYPSFKPEILKKHLIQYPSDINEQKRIADILSAFDDKIELNNQMNQTLEDMATTLFKEWFENFNFPNEQGKPYKDNDGEMKSSVLGEIPIDWEVMKISEISENISRRFKLKEHKEVVFVNTGDVLNGEFLHKDYKNPDNLPGQAKKAIKKGDILYSEIRPKNRRFARVDIDVDDYVVSTKFMVIKRNEKIGYNCLYIYLTLDSTIEQFNTIAESRSGTFPQITFDSVSNVKMTLPNNGIIMEKFEKTVEPIFEQIKLNKEQNQTLKQQRDTLLPKLMSGEIRV
ncbi:restriction endonuclease subunit S [bacterium]|nr:restriction endonuclease subunit S [bacterium]